VVHGTWAWALHPKIHRKTLMSATTRPVSRGWHRGVQWSSPDALWSVASALEHICVDLAEALS